MKNKNKNRTNLYEDAFYEDEPIHEGGRAGKLLKGVAKRINPWAQVMRRPNPGMERAPMDPSKWTKGVKLGGLGYAAGYEPTGIIGDKALWGLAPEEWEDKSKIFKWLNKDATDRGLIRGAAPFLKRTGNAAVPTLLRLGGVGTKVGNHLASGIEHASSAAKKLDDSLSSDGEGLLNKTGRSIRAIPGYVGSKSKDAARSIGRGISRAGEYAKENPYRTAATAAALGAAGAGSAIALKRAQERYSWKMRGCDTIPDPERKARCKAHTVNQELKNTRKLLNRCKYHNNPEQCYESNSKKIEKLQNRLESLQNQMGG